MCRPLDSKIGATQAPIGFHAHACCTVDDINKSCTTLRTLNYGNYGMFLIYG